MTKKILIVDDSADAVRLYSHALSSIGYSTLVADDGDSAIRMLGADLFDAALIDLRLPGSVSGFDVLAFARGNEKNRNIAAIVLSGLGDQEEVRTRCIELHAECVTKGSISLAELAQLVKSQIEKNERA